MTPTDAPEPSPTASAAPAAPVPLPWYRRPLFWTVLLLLLLLGFAGWAVWLQWQAHQARQTELGQELAQQNSANSALEAEAARLRAALDGDPCAAKGALNAPAPGEPLRVPGPSHEQEAAPDPAQEPSKETPQLPKTNTPQPDAPKTPVAPLPEPKNVAELLEQATVLILAGTEKGIQMGSGFFIAPGVVLTNKHVVGTARTDIVVVNKASQGILMGTVRTVSSEKGRDYAVLDVKPTGQASLPNIRPLVIAPGVKRTAKVSAWGFPGAVTNDDPKFQSLLKGNIQAAPEVVYTDGSVSVILERKPPLIVHTATVSQGNSGGPLVDDKGRVVGINTYIRLDDESYRQSSLAIVAADMADFLKSRKIPFTLATEKE